MPRLPLAAPGSLGERPSLSREGSSPRGVGALGSSGGAAAGPVYWPTGNGALDSSCPVTARDPAYDAMIKGVFREHEALRRQQRDEELGRSYAPIKLVVPEW